MGVLGEPILLSERSITFQQQASPSHPPTPEAGRLRGQGLGGVTEPDKDRLQGVGGEQERLWLWGGGGGSPPEREEAWG